MNIDLITDDEWENIKDGLREDRAPFLEIQGSHRKRGSDLCKIQDLMGEYYIWETPKLNQTMDLAKRMNTIG